MSRSHKRAAPADSDDESEANQEQSPPRRTSNKRRRTSDESSVPQDTFSDRENASTPASEVPSDDEDEEGEEEVFLQMTQAIEARKERGVQLNEPAEYGILEEVEVHNFMCHEKFSFGLGPLINFIVGKNGSGKSAILTAIILCLGGKASATNRGARLQNFIKQGADSATIICKIKNQGENAYLPDLYGNRIQVERHIQRGGSSGFKLKSEKGRIISTRKSDLEEICDHMMLQIENPLAVLSQDQARQFLTQSTPETKYKFFMKGVQLEQLDQDYRLIEEQLDNISAKIAERLPDLKVLKDRSERANNQMAMSDKYESMREKLREYRRQIAWSQVAAKEKSRDEYVEEFKQADHKISNVRQEVEQLDIVFQESERAAAAAKDEYDTAEAEVARLNSEKDELKAIMEKAKKELNKAVIEQRQIQSTLQTAKKAIASREKDIKNEEERLAELDGGGAARRLAEKHTAEQEVVDLKQQFEEHQGQRQARVADVSRMEALVKETTDTKTKENNRISELEQHIKALKTNRDSQDTAFHRNIKQLLTAIQHETGFQERPIGPIGKHIKLLKQEWSAILETTFGKALSGFIVTSKRDQHLLSTIMRRTQCADLPVFIANRMPLNLESHLPDERFETILSVLEIDNDLVTKQLVIANQIEQSILHPDLFEATEILRNNGSPLRNVKRCFCFHGPKDKDRGFVLTPRNGTVAQDPAHGWKGLPRMKTDAAENIRLQEQSLQERKTQCARTVQELQSAGNRLVQAKRALVAHDKQNSDLTIEVQKAETRVEELDDAIKEDNVENGKLEALHQNLQEAQNEKDVHESSYQDSIISRDEKKRELNQTHTNCNNMDERVKAARTESERVQKAAQQASSKRAYDLREKNNAIARISDAEADRAQLDERRKELETEVESFTKQAREMCEPVNIPEEETFEGLVKKFTKLREEISKWSKQVGDRDQLAAEQSKYATACRTAEKDMKRLKSLQEQLGRTLATRRSRWVQFRMHITARSRAGFIVMLSERGYRGKLHVDHKKKEMDIHVEPDITRRDGTGRSAKTLSGGEKSFSQICMLLSIWDAMGVPIRCLDEFDVYMDALNRNTSVKLLIDGARHSPSGQFVLISPGVRSDIPRDYDVNIVECAEPERGQQRLDFQPVGGN